VLASDITTEAGGRVVKLIGNEAMLVFPTAEGAAQGAIELVDARSSLGEDMPRHGLAVGGAAGPAREVRSLRLPDRFGGPHALRVALCEADRTSDPVAVQTVWAKIAP
jgi:class 3 adenylate cyclase